MVAAALAGGLALIVFGRPWDGTWPGMIGPLVIAVAVLTIGVVTSTSMRVTTGLRGVQIRCGVFGWPRFTYPRGRIASGEIVGVSIWRSWNCGISWTLRGGCTFILRSGPAIRLTLANGRRITVGVADPHAALTALHLNASAPVSHWSAQRGAPPGSTSYTDDETVVLQRATTAE